MSGPGSLRRPRSPSALGGAMSEPFAIKIEATAEVIRGENLEESE